MGIIDHVKDLLNSRKERNIGSVPEVRGNVDKEKLMERIAGNNSRDILNVGEENYNLTN